MKVPTLIVVGDEDEPCVKPSHFLHDTIPGARLEVIRKCGHLVNIEEPAILNPMVLGFVEACEAKR
jgi:pimeloyl-ACP methyl ester carboxylesterase